jgi:hypothetical protein
MIVVVMSVFTARVSALDASLKVDPGASCVRGDSARRAR